MNKRKLLGTILGIIFWSCCISFFTFAYYEWKSDNTNVVLGIQDLSTKCIPGTDVTATNIGPVLDYRDGVKVGFSIENETSKEMAIDLRLDITSISDNLKTESFKYAIVTDTTGGTNYDYNNPVFTDSFDNFEIGSNLIMTDLAVTASTTQSFLFIVYIDGNMYNSSNMQENSLVANLMIGNCEEDSTPMDTLVYQAIYSVDDQSLTFVHTTPLTAGDTYNGKAVTSVYTGFETTEYTSSSAVPWANDDSITTVTFEAVTSPISTKLWFASLPNVTTFDLERLDTSNVTNMSYMFYGCSKLTNLDLSNWDVSNVTNMLAMFANCSSLTNLDTNSWDTGKVTNMSYMFQSCSSITNLDIGNWDTSSVEDFNRLFLRATGLINLDLSNWNVSNVTNMSGMFNECTNLVNLNINGWNAVKTTNMSGMFNKCTSLVNLNISGLKTTSVTNISNMFSDCHDLVSLDLSSFDTSKVTTLSQMFFYCVSLTNLDLSSFDTSKVTTMQYMFYNCTSLTNLDLSSFDTSKVTTMQGMFYNCSKLNVTITIMNVNTTWSSMAGPNGFTAEGALLTLNYVGDNPATATVNESTKSLVETIVSDAELTTNAKVVKGNCIGNYCTTAVEATEEETTGNVEG